MECVFDAFPLDMSVREESIHGIFLHFITPTHTNRPLFCLFNPQHEICAFSVSLFSERVDKTLTRQCAPSCIWAFLGRGCEGILVCGWLTRLCQKYVVLVSSSLSFGASFVVWEIVLSFQMIYVRIIRWIKFDMTHSLYDFSYQIFSLRDTKSCLNSFFSWCASYRNLIKLILYTLPDFCS